MLKKIIIISILIITSIGNLANAYCNYDYNCPYHEPVNGPISFTLSKITGMNALIGNTLELQVKKQLDKALDGNFKVKITPYGGLSMLQGKFKRLEFDAPKAKIDDIFLSNIKAESLCEYNHFIYQKGEVFTNEDFIIGFSTEITNEDLKEMVNTQSYQKLIKSMNIKAGNFSFIKVYEPIAEIKDTKLKFSVKVLSPLTYYEPKTISTTMGLAVEDGKLIFTEITTTPQLKTNLNSFVPIINKINPFIINTEILNNSSSKIKIKKIQIIDNKIFVKGLVIVPKNYYNN